MSDYTDKSHFGKAFNPVYLAAGVAAANLIVVLGGKFAHLTGITEVGQRFPWMSAASFLLFFAIFNSIFSLSAKDGAQFWSRSMMSFIGLAVVNGLLAWLFSSLSINEAGSYRWIYMVVAFGYLVFMSIMNFMKKIVEFAQREEWNHPRIRSRKRK
jgi:hypothetical protein